MRESGVRPLKKRVVGLYQSFINVKLTGRPYLAQLDHCSSSQSNLEIFHISFASRPSSARNNPGYGKSGLVVKGLFLKRLLVHVLLLLPLLLHWLPTTSMQTRKTKGEMRAMMPPAAIAVWW